MAKKKKNPQILKSFSEQAWELEERAKVIYRDPLKSQELFYHITDKTRQGVRITDAVEKKYLDHLIVNTLVFDEAAQFQVFLDTKIQAEDTSSGSSFFIRALSQSATNCLALLFEADKSLSIHSPVKTTYDLIPLTVLEFALERCDKKTIDFLVQHAITNNSNYIIQDAISRAMGNPNSSFEHKTEILERVLQYGFSPYSEDNNNKGQSTNRIDNGDAVFSILFKSISHVEDHTDPFIFIIEHMNDLEKLKKEKELFEKILSKGWSGLEGRDDKIFKLLNHKIQILEEKNILSATLDTLNTLQPVRHEQTLSVPHKIQKI